MKRVLIILFMGFMLFAFGGCNTKEVVNVPSKPEIMKLADENESNFVIRVDYNEKMDMI